MTDATSSGGHDHIHRESGPPQADDKVHSYYQILGIALQELLIEKGIVSADEVRQMIERRDAITPARGAKIVARAWTDADFKARFLADGNAGAAELDCPMTYTELVAVENTPEAHNVIVCTLCSCYPRELLGLPPSWYKSREYRARVVRDPRAVLKEFGTEIGDHVEIRVHDSTADIRYLVIPRRPAGTEGMTESELEDLVTRDSMIGVAEAKTPGK